MEGTCKLCNRICELTFEHVPPRSCFNKTTRYYTSSFHEYVTNSIDKKSKLKQGGTGGDYYCKNCNNFLGKKYVKSYKFWVQLGVGMIKKYDKTILNDFILDGLKPLNILKLISSFFISINEIESDIISELKLFVSDVNSKKFPDNLNLYCYLNDTGNIRVVPQIFHMKFGSKRGNTLSEFTFPPFGFVLSLDKIEHKRLTDITGFKNYDFDSKHSIRIQIFKNDTHYSLPLDYRSKKEIEDEEFKKY